MDDDDEVGYEVEDEGVNGVDDTISFEGGMFEERKDAEEAEGAEEAVGDSANTFLL
jgi:hypothetical protein